MGVAPSPEILADWNKREGDLIAANAHIDRDFAKPPEPKCAHAGAGGPSVLEKVKHEGARTIPVRQFLPYLHLNGYLIT